MASYQYSIPAQSQPSNLPSAIFVDPPRDSAIPMRNEAVWIPSGGLLMNGVMYAAAGIRSHPTVLNIHGTPGNEQNMDIAQTLRRAGYNVLSFHYRGAWGSPGKFTQAGGVDDCDAALAFLQDSAVGSRFHIDTKRLIVIGHSYGGFAAARIAAAHPNIAALVLLAPWNPAQDIPLFTVPPEKFAAAAHSIFDDDEGRMGGYTDVDMAKEILAPGYDWRLETSAEAGACSGCQNGLDGYGSPLHGSSDCSRKRDSRLVATTNFREGNAVNFSPIRRTRQSKSL